LLFGLYGPPRPIATGEEAKWHGTTRFTPTGSATAKRFWCWCMAKAPMAMCGTGCVPSLRATGAARASFPICAVTASPHRAPYSYGTYAADIASLIRPGQEIFLIGHSLGGAVSLMLATGWFGVRVRGVFAFGTKVNWSDEDLARRRQFAAAPMRWFDRRADAVERYLKISGQFGIVDPA